MTHAWGVNLHISFHICVYFADLYVVYMLANLGVLVNVAHLQMKMQLHNLSHLQLKN